MRGKVFGLLLAALAVAVGVSLFHLSGDPPGDGGPTPPKNGTATKDPGPDPDRVPEAPESSRGETGTTTRIELPEDVAVDHSEVLTIRGRVVEAGSGAPIDEAEVEILYPDGDEVSSATSGEDGRYEVAIEDGVPPALAFRCWADGYTIVSAEPRRVTREQRVMVVDFELASSFIVEGRVISAVDGTPVEGADVEIRSGLPLFEDDWDDGETDDSGYFRIEDIEDLPREGLDVVVEPIDHAPMVKRNLSLQPGQNVLRVDFTLYESITLVGVVTSRVNGQPIEDAMVSISSLDRDYEDDGEDEITDEDGSFELETDTLPLDGLYVLISADDHAAVRIDPVPAPDREGVIQLGTIALGPPVVVQGFVRNARNGAVVQGGDVYAFPVEAPGDEDSDYVDEELVDAQGRFELTLEYATPGAFDLIVESDGYEPSRQRVSVPAGAQMHQVQVDLEPVVILTGAVRRQVDNTPVPGAAVRVLTQGEEGDFSARTRADGRYRLELPASDLTRFSVVIESLGQRFLMGALTNPREGQFQLVKDFVVDVPARPGR